MAVARIENMFDGLQGADELLRADDATVVAAIAEWTRAEAAASSRRLAAIAELVRRRAVGPVDHAMWSCDNWDAMAAEVSAAQGISHSRASGQMHQAVALRDRLPEVAALFYDGAISARLAAAIVWHTDLIKDPDTLRLVDTALAKSAARYGPLSVNKTAQAIDAIVDRYDPGALRRTRAAARSRDLVVDLANDESGTAAVGAGCTPPTPRLWSDGSGKWPTMSAMTTRGLSPSAVPTRWARSPREQSDSAVAATTPNARRAYSTTSARRVSSSTSSPSRRRCRVRPHPRALTGHPR